MTVSADFVVVGGGSAGAVVAARLSEDPGVTVILLEAGGRPPAAELMPAACPVLQNDPAVDWMFTADPGEAGLGMRDRRMMVPRGKMLGGSSGINYMAYVRGHPGDFDAWAAGGATGWGYDEVLPYFRKSEGLVPNDELPIDADVHGTQGPLGVAVRQPIQPAAQAFVDAAVAVGLTLGDYNGRERGGATGVVSLAQTTTKNGKRSSTYHAFLEGETEQRPNLTIVTGAHATKVVIDGNTATGVEYRDADGNTQTATAAKEVVLAAGAVGSPHLLLLSGVGPKDELENLGIASTVDNSHVGKHLKDHVEIGLFYQAPGLGVPMVNMAVAMGPDALPPEAEALKPEAERQVTEWFVNGTGLASSSLYDGLAWFSTGLGDEHTHDGQLAIFCTGYNEDIWRGCLRVDPAELLADPAISLAPTAENILVLANPVQPHSEGSISLASADPTAQPDIAMNYFGDPHDLKVMVAVVRKALEVVAHWPEEHKLGPLQVPPALAAKHHHVPGDELTDELIEDIARHYSATVYHLTSTCRIGDVVDPELKVLGLQGLRVADASVMPNVPSGNTNAACIMIGEKAAELIAREHGVALAEFVSP